MDGCLVSHLRKACWRVGVESRCGVWTGGSVGLAGVGALPSSPVGEGSKMDGSLILSRDERDLSYFPVLSTRTRAGRSGRALIPLPTGLF